MAAPKPTNSVASENNANANDFTDFLSQLSPMIMNNVWSMQYIKGLLDNKALRDTLCQGFKDLNIDITNKITAEFVNDANRGRLSKWLNCLCEQFDHFSGMDTEDCVSSLCECQEKLLELEPDCNDTAFQQSLNNFHITYFGAALFMLYRSYEQIDQTHKDLHHASKRATEIRNELQQIRQEKIAPIKQYFEKIHRQRVIDDLKEYRYFEQMISDTLRALQGLKRECGLIKEAAKSNAIQGASSAFGQGHSAWTSYSLSFMMPQYGALYAGLSALQAGSSLLHGKQAYDSYKSQQEYSKLEQEIANEIGDIEEIKSVLSRYGKSEQYLSPKLWVAAQVVTWLKSEEGGKYDVIADVFMKEDINGQDLMEMDHETLEEMGMSSRLSRKRLLRKISKLFEQKK